MTKSQDKRRRHKGNGRYSIERRKTTVRRSKAEIIAADFAPRKRRRKLTDLQMRFLSYRSMGHTPKEAYTLAGGKGLDLNSSPYKLEKAVQEFFVTRDDMLQDGRAAAKKIFADFLDGKKTAHVPAVTKIIQMQQDRLDPPIKKTQSRNLHEHMVSPEIIAEVNDTYMKMMKSAAKWGKGMPEFIEGGAMSRNSA